METKILSPMELKQAVEFLRDGELVAFPTETVYGLGADATNEAAVKKVYQAKGRPSDNPLIVTVSDVSMVETFAENIPADAKKLMDNFWPGPLTILLKVKPDTLPQVVTGGLDTVAFRNPDHQLTLDLISSLNRPIVGPSANTSTKPSPTSAQHVNHDLNGKIAAIIDGGMTSVGLESTIVDLTVSPYAILRPGEITAEAISRVLEKPVVGGNHVVSAGETPKAPGMKYRHYAPKNDVVIVDSDADFSKIPVNDNQVAVVSLQSVIDRIKPRHSFSLGQDVTSASHHLFEALRYFDEQENIKTIYVQGFSDGDLAEAYMNRLEKSAAGKHFG